MAHAEERGDGASDSVSPYWTDTLAGKQQGLCYFCFLSLSLGFFSSDRSESVKQQFMSVYSVSDTAPRTGDLALNEIVGNHGDYMLLW